MSWTPLAERFSSLPLILAGPMLRRTELRAVTVWLALKEARIVTLCIYSRDAGGKLVQQLEGRAIQFAWVTTCISWLSQLVPPPNMSGWPGATPLL